MSTLHSIEFRPYTRCTYITDNDTGAVCDRRVAGWSADDNGAVIVTACADHMDGGTTGLAALLGLATGAELDRRVEAALAEEAGR